MATTSASKPQTLAIDIGGTGLKASVLDEAGKMVEQHVRVPTPDPCTGIRSPIAAWCPSSRAAMMTMMEAVLRVP